MFLHPHANQSQSALEVKLESRKWVKSNYSVNVYAPTWARMFYSCTRALHPHACPTLARIFHCRRPIPLPQGYSAPKCTSSSHTRIPLPHAYSAPACVTRLCPRIARSCTRVLLTRAYPTLARLFFCWSWTTSQCLTDAPILTVWEPKA